MFLIVSNPVNSLVPLFAEVLKKAGVYRPGHLFGLSSLDAVRARTFVADALQCDVADERCAVTVIGGHAGETILPLLSQSCVGDVLSADAVAALSRRVQFAGDEIVAAKAGEGSATLSMAYAAHRFASRLLTAMHRPALEKVRKILCALATRCNSFGNSEQLFGNALLMPRERLMFASRALNVRLSFF
jgi:malate dehydrogenase